MFPWEEYYSGQKLRVVMDENKDLVCYVVFLYLGMIHYGPGIAKRLLGENAPPRLNAKGVMVPARDPEWLRITMILWNLLLSTFSFFGMIVMVPAQIQTIRAIGLHNTICKSHENLTYSSACGFWMTLFSLSKVPELVDTLWLVLQKKKTPPFLHWYHHAATLIFSWYSFTQGNSNIILFASMNITVHTIMYFYFCLCACGFKKIVRPIAPLITSIQILQMIGGTALTFYSYWVNYTAYKTNVSDLDELPCAVGQGIARFGCLMYLSYLYLFTRMFVNSYMTKPKTTSRKTDSHENKVSSIAQSKKQ